MYIDMTGLASAAVAGVFSILAVVVPLILQKYLKDKQAATVLSNAVVNALGAIQQAAVTGKTPPVIAGVSPDVAVGVQYVTDHAGAEADRFGVTREAIADKIAARQGLQSLAVAAAQAASPPAPVAVVAVGDPPTGTMPRPLYRS